MEICRRYFPRAWITMVSYDTTRYVSTAVQQVVISLFQAVALVIAITFLFLGTGAPPWCPALAIPVSLVATFAVTAGHGHVDQHRDPVRPDPGHRHRGGRRDSGDRELRPSPAGRSDHVPPAEAALVTMREVGGAVIATTLVLLAVFVPVAMLPGITGEMYRQFAVTICVAVVFSSLNALTLSPGPVQPATEAG